jgi:cell fate regulator YaaT (PSP1 superfamily)
MPKVIAVTFRSAGQVHYYDPGGMELKEGDAVIAPTPHGIEIGQVMTEPRELEADHPDQPLRPVTRKASADDLRREQENRERERRAFDTCAERIQQHGLPMKLIEAHYTFDRSRVIFYFSAEGRVDFRCLVRDLARELRARVELHQVGVRDEAKLIGGFGPCGRPLCCATFLSRLQPVAIKMAKEQNLALNPLKISGVCGRLMCCLSYEYEGYRRAKAELPRVGSRITLPQGAGKVTEVNIIKGTLSVALEDGTRVEVAAHQCAGGAERPCAPPAGGEIGGGEVAPVAGADPAAPPRPTSSDQQAPPRPRRRRSRRGGSRKPKPDAPQQG